MQEALIDSLLEAITTGMYDATQAVSDLCEIDSSSEDLVYEAPKMTQKVGEVTFNQKSGIGQTDMDADIRRHGFVIYMKPKEFLKLNPYRSKAIENLPAIHDLLFIQKKAMVSPFLIAEWNPKERFWKIKGHEGRGRCMSLHAHQRDIEVPVHVLPRLPDKKDLPAKELTPEMTQAAFIPDDRALHDMMLDWKPAPFFRRRKVEVATPKYTQGEVDPFPRPPDFKEG